MPEEFFDLLVVGSGAVGATFARTVHDAVPSARILIVDSGPALTEVAGVNLKNLLEPAAPDLTPEAGDDKARAIARGTESLARRGTRLLDPPSPDLPGGAFSSNVGGMTAHWTCASPRPAEVERVPFIDGAELDEHFRDAERLLRVNTRVLEDAVNDELSAALAGVFDQRLSGGRKVQPMPLACYLNGDGHVRWTGVDTVLGPIAHPDLRPDSVVLRPLTLCRELYADGGRVAGALLRDLRTGDSYAIRVGAAVVAADAIRTPQLLHASGLGGDALGSFFNDQPQVLSAVHLAPAFRTERQLTPRGYRIPRGVLWVPFDRESHPFHGQVMHFDLSSVKARGIAEGNESVVALSWFCAKEPRRRDRIEFASDSVDAYGMPAPVVHHEWTDEDHANVAAAMQCQIEAADRIGEFVDGQKPQALPPGSSLHYQGSVRMGPTDDGSSVCDSFSRVWRTSNLYVGGNGVIPTATACNPTLTSVALALRASEDLVRLVRASQTVN